MKHWSKWNFVAALATAVVVCLLYFYARREPASQKPSAPVVSAPRAVSPALGATHPASTPPGGKPFRVRRGELNEAAEWALKDKIEQKLKPAAEAFCKAYSGHVPFKPEGITFDNFYEQIGRGTSFNTYVFMVNSNTVAIEESNGAARLSYLNSPDSKQLMLLPKGAAPSNDISVGRDEVSKMIKLDSGVEFPPAEVRMIPTAFSSAMNGGVNVTVGGDPNNIASWKYTLVFGPQGYLSYYLRKHE